jgi:hypothetical protein
MPTLRVAWATATRADFALPSSRAACDPARFLLGELTEIGPSEADSHGLVVAACCQQLQSCLPGCDVDVAPAAAFFVPPALPAVLHGRYLVSFAATVRACWLLQRLGTATAVRGRTVVVLQAGSSVGLATMHILRAHWGPACLVAVADEQDGVEAVARFAAIPAAAAAAATASAPAVVPVVPFAPSGPSATGADDGRANVDAGALLYSAVMRHTAGEGAAAVIDVRDDPDDGWRGGDEALAGSHAGDQLSLDRVLEVLAWGGHALTDRPCGGLEVDYHTAATLHAKGASLHAVTPAAMVRAAATGGSGGVRAWLAAAEAAVAYLDDGTVPWRPGHTALAVGVGTGSEAAPGEAGSAAAWLEATDPPACALPPPLEVKLPARDGGDGGVAVRASDATPGSRGGGPDRFPAPPTSRSLAWPAGEARPGAGGGLGAAAALAHVAAALAGTASDDGARGCARGRVAVVMGGE